MSKYSDDDNLNAMLHMVTHYVVQTKWKTYNSIEDMRKELIHILRILKLRTKSKQLEESAELLVQLPESKWQELIDKLDLQQTFYPETKP